MPHSSIVINKKIIPPPPPSLIQTNSLLLPNDEMRSNVATVGITDTWSLAMWAKLNTGGNIKRMLLLAPAGDGLNAISVTTASSFTVDDLVITISGSTGGRQAKTWNGVIQGETDTWVHYVFTFGGDAGNGANGLKLYTQGIDEGAPDIVTQDLSGNTVDVTRWSRLALGSAGQHWSGPMYSYAIYDTILSAEAIAQMYNNGNAVGFDLDNDFGNYTSSANLVHYYRLGIGTTEADFGLDRTDTVPSLDMDALVGSLTVDDLTTDVPDGT
jgi:hypothetical protein